MEDSTKRFSDRVQNYVNFRPAYPMELINSLMENCRLNRDSTIADIGSGTGILTQHLLDKQLPVIAIEPNKEMREAAESMLSNYSRFSSVTGTAEDTSLTDSSIDLITVAQAFHWFDWPKALTEFRRILKPQGQLALIWNRRDQNDAFQQSYEIMLRELAPEYNLVNHMNIEDEKIAAIFDANHFQHICFRYTQFFDCTAFLGRMQSSSYAPAQGTKALDKLNEAAVVLFEKFAVDGTLAFEYISHLYLGQLKRQGLGSTLREI